MQYTPPLYPAQHLDPRQPTGLLYLGLGGPDGIDAVAPFLTNLFADPLVLPMPAWLSRPVGKLIVRRRLREVRSRYQQLGFGGGSPQLDWCRKQAAELSLQLERRDLTIHPAVAMRYWHPFTGEAISDIRSRGAEQLLIVPTYPQYSAATTGSSLAELERALADTDWDPPRHVLREWPLLPGYVDRLASGAATVLNAWRGAGKDPAATALVFTAHSLPRRFLRHGDPYVRQSRATVRAVHHRLRDTIGDHTWLHRLRGGSQEPLRAFQSKVGPVKWVGPATDTTCCNLARAGVKHLLVVPVSFNCEHIETILELDDELSTAVRELGVVDFARTPALNLDPGWLRSLADHLAGRAFGLDLEPAETRTHD